MRSRKKDQGDDQIKQMVEKNQDFIAALKKMKKSLENDRNSEKNKGELIKKMKFS